MEAKMVGQPKHEQSIASSFLGQGRSSRAHASGATDDTELGRKIIATHESNERGFDVKPVLAVIDVIFNRASDDIFKFSQGPITQWDIVVAEEKVVDLPTRVISAISLEMYSKCSAGVDVHNIVLEILRLVKHYSWEVKVALVLVSLMITFGKFRLVVQQYTTNPLPKAIALLKQLPEILEHLHDLKPTLDALFTLIGEIIDTTKELVELYELPEVIAVDANVPTVVYWSIRSIVVASTQMFALTGSLPIDLLTESWELSSLAHKLNNIKTLHLVELIERCLKVMQEKRDEEAFRELERIFTTPHLDNTRALATLFHYKDGQPALYDCYIKRKVATDELSNKTVALFITDLDFNLQRGQEYKILERMYQQKKHSPTKMESQYEIVWVPILDNWDEDKLNLFETLQKQMEWHSIDHPSVVSTVVKRYIKEKWNFKKKPMLVVIDKQGAIVHHDAINMICIWGSTAYPFTFNREKLLWEEMSWSVDLLIDNLEPNLNAWIQEGKHICLYGGEDMEWISDFTIAAKKVAREAGINLEMVYVGKTQTKEKLVTTIIDTIQKENLSRTLDRNLISYFWLRLMKMLDSKRQLTKFDSTRYDHILEGITVILSYDSSDYSKGRWAVMSKDIGEMVRGKGTHMLKALTEHRVWKPRQQEIGFVPALDEYLKEYVQPLEPHHCTSLVLPSSAALPDVMKCCDCGRLMETYTLFRCCLE
ncbi:protein SIEVE ELEMENT OCCLUSION B-like [Humulus lupulus]|uniref:protein SIEVE ELEMENT OCCLUSION B-like n=1 Tax=Humulus lupulus TaxID=3486 RepID=UPI002B40D8EF|nr:protein SIEVE ELEMENT OCCLUSION B-like [Humulus lupulus]